MKMAINGQLSFKVDANGHESIKMDRNGHLSFKVDTNGQESLKMDRNKIPVELVWII